MKRLIVHKIVAGLILAMTLPSCRAWILEDRTVCPSFVFFDVQDANGLARTRDIVVEVKTLPEGAELARDTVALGTLDSRSYHLEVSKSSHVVASGITGVRIAAKEGSQWTVPVGSQWEPVYIFNSEADATGEETHIPVVFTKEHSQVTVRFHSDDGLFPYYVVAKSGTCGMDASTGKPVKGIFRYTPAEGNPGEFSFIVPRQADYGLSLEMWAKSGVSAEEGKVDEILLWSALERVPRFDWSLTNLPDIIVDIDYVRSQLTLTVNDWTEVVTLDYKI